MICKLYSALTTFGIIIVMIMPANAQTTSGAIPASFFGMSVLNPSSETIPSGFPYAIARSWDASPAMDWSDLNPSSGSLNFSAIDTFLTQNQSRLPNVIYTLGRTPQWASSNPNAAGHYGNGQCAPPADLRNWDNYVRLSVIHAAGQIKYWELWNEPQDPQYYCGTVASMVMMAQHASTIIKSIDPAAVIISPGTGGGSTTGPQWLAAFLAAGGGRYIDAIGFHGYDNTTAESVPTVITSYQSVMHKYGVASKPLFDTAASWGNTTSLTIAQQAAFLAKYYLLHWSWGVSNLTWYAYDSGSWGSLMDTSHNPTAAATAYSQIYNWMVGATMTSPCSKDGNNIWSCTLTQVNGSQAEITWNSSASMSVTVPSQYNEYRDLTGAVTPITNNTITIGNSPVLLDYVQATSNSQSNPPTITVSTIESLGVIPASQPINGLGFNLTPQNDWEFQMAAAAGATHGRVQCSWSQVEIQKAPPANAASSPQYTTVLSKCQAALVSFKKYGIHPTLLAAFGSPYHPILLVTMPNGAAAGSTSIEVQFASGIGGDTLASMVPFYDHIMGLGSVQITNRYSYAGGLITGVKQVDATHAILTLASAITTPFPPGSTAQYTVNELLYPSAATASPTDPSVVAYANYARYLASQIASSGLTGEVELWNEPPWAHDPWDNRRDFYDTDPHTPGELIGNNPNYGFAAAIQNGAAPPAGVNYNWGGTEKSGSTTLLGPGMLSNTGVSFKEPGTSVTTESFHPYGINPEDETFNWPCLVASVVPAKPTGAQACNMENFSSSNLVNAVQMDLSQKKINPAYGIGHNITETGFHVPIDGDEAHKTRFIMRQFLGFQADHISPIEFYRFSDTSSLATGSGYGFADAVTHAPLPDYIAIAGLMADLNTMGGAAIGSYTVPTIKSYSGTFPLDVLSIVGSRTGDTATSIMFAIWQRTNNGSTTALTWNSMPATPPGPVTVNIPAGLSIANVVNMDTRVAVPYTLSGQTITFTVADDPVEILAYPAH